MTRPPSTRTRQLRLLLPAALLLLLSICALGQSSAPRVASLTADPTPVLPGQPVSLVCRLDDPGGVVAKIGGAVREIPYYALTFTRQPDGSWLCVVPVPADSDPATYHVDLTLLGADGKPVQPAAASPTTVSIVIAPAAGAGEEPAPERPAVADHGAPTTVMVPMRDGVRLATDVYRGQGDGPWPVILLRTPYGRQDTPLAGLRDYAVVVQDWRGRFGSEGNALVCFNDGWGEHQDGLDTVRWILKQPWCNGKIATMGESALGLAQSLLAGTSPPGVVCQRIEVAPADVYGDAVYPGGVFAEAFMAGWLKSKGWPEHNLDLVLAHPTYDSLWQSVDTTRRLPAQRVSIPAVHIGGWHDLFTDGTISAFTTRRRIADNQWLVMGPWTHGMTRQAGEIEFPANAIDLPGPARAEVWLDYWMRGVDTGLRRMPRVHYYVMGACGEPGAPGNEWRTAANWPIPAAATRLYLAPQGKLVAKAPPAGARLSYTYDPANPVPTRGGRNLALPPGPMDQRELETRPDVLVFTTPPLEQPLEVTGRVTLEVWAASSAPDTVFTAKLCDVYPDGRSMLVEDGALRAACRTSLARPEPLQPGKPYRFTIDLGSTSLIFNRGHRVRLDVSSSNYPRFAAHPNTWGGGKPQVAKQTVFLGGKQPSALVLPVVTASR